MRKPVYLDYNATAPVRPAAAEAVMQALQETGNASSVHAFGRAARRFSISTIRSNVTYRSRNVALAISACRCCTQTNWLAEPIAKRIAAKVDLK